MNPSSGELQFQKAEFNEAGRRCALCQAPIAGSYYQYGGHVVCENCAAQRAELRGPGGPVNFSRALMYGFGAAFAGSVLYAVVTMATGYQLSLISILIGFMVGKAVHRGTQGRGGPRYQVLAVVLTYFAITTSYVPQMLIGVKPGDGKETITSPAPPEASVFRTARTITVLTGFALIAPIVILVRSPGRGILHALIILFGLLQAWRQTRGNTLPLTGPYRVNRS